MFSPAVNYDCLFFNIAEYEQNEKVSPAVPM